MKNFNEVKEFFPTPVNLLEKITEGIDWKKVSTILEPSAGKGDIAKFVEEKLKEKLDWRYREADIDCIEIDPQLQAVLKENGCRLIHNDFLSFRTYKKYDLIIMNPPFSNGATHLTKAIDIASMHGSNIICILNAETIRNPYTNERKALNQKLNDLNADISFMENEFVSAERSTSVEIAVVKVIVPEPEHESVFMSRAKLTQKEYSEFHYEATDVAEYDFMKNIVSAYECEVSAGINLINEYRSLCPYIQDQINNTYSSPTIELRVNNSTSFDTNTYVKLVRSKYWEALFKDKRFTGRMTNNQYSEYANKVKELANYDFSLHNIMQLKIEMTENLVKGIEETIINLFDELSHQYSWEPGTTRNIHYYNGWRTNCSFMINSKVIFPVYGVWSKIWKRFEYKYDVLRKLSDIEKALNYLDGGLSDGVSLEYVLRNAEENQISRDIQCKYFSLTFFKKGTCHLKFTNEELLKKLNIFGSQQKKWLPYSYGRKTYEEMDQEERNVVDSFEGGKEEYKKTLAKKDFYIYEPKNSLPLLA